MGELVKDLLVFVGRRIERAKALAVYLDVPEGAYAGMNAEEKANARESVQRDAIYLQGVVDGLRLGRMVSGEKV